MIVAAAGLPRTVDDIPTPALVVERSAFERNLSVMAEALPGARLRPHVTPHKSIAVAWRQHDMGHPGLTAETIRECEGLAAAGLGQDLLLASEVLDARRLGALVDAGHRVTLAVDSETTIKAAASGGVREVVVDVNVNVPRSGCPPERAGQLAEVARGLGLEVRGVMGDDGHLQLLADRADRQRYCREAMTRLLQAHEAVGGELITGGGTGTYEVNTWLTEVQAGSYVLLDAAYDALEIPFVPALTMLTTVISLGAAWGVLDAGLTAQGMDHGAPTLRGADVWFLSEEQLTFAPAEPGMFEVGDRVRYVPAHMGPTCAYHEQMWLVDGERVLERWPVDLRGW